ncbi:MAG TPA: efflux RND transporter periplasmic adaptor subunit [Lacibacter sp.]|nr:efflux RND transporter periplasmic adaptor subunit [Lacibacter sp.]HMO88414.1 efflux RND transporter periplasmic adaptor subunit [Lacibacter sp.]HMP86298.1 efflux RND transporter periplasmic adaptor subunit [Lacibacter sp.]
MQHRYTYSGVVAVFLLLLAAGFTSCNQTKGKATDKPETYRVTNPLVVDTTFQEEYVAEIHSLQNVEIRTRVKGFIEQIHIDEGRNAAAGQLLFTLSSRTFREDLLRANAQLKSTTAELKAVEVELNNTKLLVEKGIVSKSELEMMLAKREAVQARIEEANSAIALAKLNLSYTGIRAPFSGVINRIPNKRGSLVDEGTLLTTLSNNQEVFAYFNFSESDYLNYITSGEMDQFSTVELKLANLQLYGYKGRIEVSESEFDAASGNIAFRARFPNPDGLLKHGGNGKIIITKPLRNAVLVPQRSTFEIQDKVFVYVVNDQNIVKQKAITTGKRLPHFYVVESGIRPGDKIILEGVENLKNGQQITPQEVSSANLLNKEDEQ